MRHVLLISVLAATAAVPCLAHAEEPVSGASLTLQAQARATAPADEMVVVLRTVQEGVNLGAVNQRVLSQLQAAIQEAKGLPGVHARLGAVSTQQRYAPTTGTPDGWRVHGEVILDSSQLKELGELTGKLSQRLQLGDVSFRLSQQKQANLEAQLLQEVSVAFKEKAQLTTQALGFTGYRLGALHLSQSRQPPAGIAPLTTMRAAPAALPTEGGEQEMSVTLSGTVYPK